MKTYKIVPHPVMFILAVICLLLGAVIIFLPKGVPNQLHIITLLASSILLFIVSIIFGEIKEINQGELLDGE